MFDSGNGDDVIGSIVGDHDGIGEEVVILSCTILRGGPGCWTPGGAATEKTAGFGQERLLLD